MSDPSHKACSDGPPHRTDHHGDLEAKRILQCFLRGEEIVALACETVDYPTMLVPEAIAFGTGILEFRIRRSLPPLRSRKFLFELTNAHLEVMHLSATRLGTQETTVSRDNSGLDALIK